MGRARDDNERPSLQAYNEGTLDVCARSATKNSFDIDDASTYMRHMR